MINHCSTHQSLYYDLPIGKRVDHRLNIVNLLYHIYVIIGHLHLFVISRSNCFSEKLLIKKVWYLKIQISYGV